MSETNDRRPLSEELLDVFVYAPAGVAARLIEELPELVDSGRSKVEKKVSTARLVGKLAVARTAGRIKAVLRDVGVAEQTEATDATGSPGAGDIGARTDAIAPESKPDPASLPIVEYDTLAASQVIARLEGLSTDELALVGRYELATRHRRTILAKIAQLEGS